MKFNILHAVESAATSFITSGGNPIATGVGAISGGFAGSDPASSGAGGPAAQMSPDLLNELLQNTPSMSALDPLMPNQQQNAASKDTSSFSGLVFDDSDGN